MLTDNAGPRPVSCGTLDDMPTRTGTAAAKPDADDLAVQRAQDQQILELALSGRNGPQIAAEVGVARSTVHKTLHRIWDRTEQPKATALRTKWDLRIEAAIGGLWPKVLDGDVTAVNAFVRLAERAAKMHGLDQQVSRDAGALAEALLSDPDARTQRAQQLRDDLAARRAEREQEHRETG